MQVLFARRRYVEGGVDFKMYEYETLYSCDSLAVYDLFIELKEAA